MTLIWPKSSKSSEERWQLPIAISTSSCYAPNESCCVCIAMISRVPLFWFLHTRDVCRLSIYVSIEFPASCAHSRRCLCAIERRKMGELHKHTPKLIKLAYENDHMSASDYMMAMMIDEILHRRREKSGLCSLSRLEDEQSFENSVEQIAIAAIRWKIIISRI